VQRAIEVQQPVPFDIVGRHVHFAGVALAFTTSVRVQLLGADGSLIEARSVRADRTSELSTFSGSFELRRTPSDPAGTLAMSNAHTDGDRVEVPIVFGTALLRNYFAYTTYVVRPNDTLWVVAERIYGTGERWAMLHRANRHLVPDPELIHPGQELRIPRETVPG
jgi:nucleoid-associated protein YgaU